MALSGLRMWSSGIQMITKFNVTATRLYAMGGSLKGRPVGLYEACPESKDTSHVGR